MRRIVCGLLLAWVLWAEVRVSGQREFVALDSYQTRAECDGDMAERRDRFIREFQSSAGYKSPGWYVREIRDRSVLLEQPGIREEALIIFVCLPPGTSPRG